MIGEKAHQLSSGPSVVGSKHEESDAELVRRCLAGETSCFTRLVERYDRVLYNLALRMVTDEEDARDVVQASFVKTYEKLSSFDPRYKFFSWIYKITVNECLNQINRRRRIEPLDPRIDIPSRENAAASLEAREASERVQEALLHLTPDHREVVILRHFLEMSYGEIAGTLTIAEKTVKSRLYEARQRLCELMPEKAA